mmetsp:Transcript_7834/g.22986  ORF Transcript_7834/g.22986 Transcript_7834/m.22986 type:complete len:90 (-) Transcript_7834:910-1179(-)
MHFCNGGDLYYLLSRCRKFRESQARFYAGEVFLAIQHLHSLGIIYRDLKPENVLLDSDGHVTLRSPPYLPTSPHISLISRQACQADRLR